ncbi:hypothetical protein DYBT9623_03776 [Dyadobacter sp. CECT 9623]|uniref:Por secretion system C-terminal sorting domain-containing protein n=1 Tax=Dyadobacter linearis TaxID=2823330 RepID=A0ABM8UTX9_9BACT|nr:sialate O-acetylesterase [Dyadobacter sp. CECT 9623]CAG5071790.1 hypothetical protein DYBT9623_03776 [Dyadobacter sp. CECT 9623]
MNFTHKLFTLLLLLIFSSQIASGQRFFAVAFNKLPKDMQLYAREDDNTAEVQIAGKIEATGWEHMSVVTFRNNKRIGYHKDTLIYGGQSSASFDMKPTIKAEMADYDFAIYACKSADSVLIVKRTDVVAGDFYVISGQSNAAATHFGSWTNKYARTIARIPDGNPSIGIGDTLWIPSSWSWPYAGAWGVELQKRILEKDSIPTCVINGALPGSYISYHVDRNAQDPASATLYGLLYRRIKAARPKRIRAFFWYQGEQEAIEDIKNYDQQYDKLFKYWQTDYPEVEKYIVVQIPVLFNPFYEAGKIREFQRKTKYIYPKTDHFNVNGMPGFDGIHYSLAGYQEMGRRFFEFIQPMYYGSTDTSNVACPDVQKVFYSSEKKDEIKLYFDAGQSLVWPKDTLVEDVKGSKFLKGLKDVFFFDGDETKPADITSGTASKNVVILKLNSASAAKNLTYLPAYKGEKVDTYYGPFLKNKRDLGAFSFQELPIADALIFPVFQAKESDAGTVIVSWESAGAESFVFERKGPGDAGYAPVEDYDGKALSYEDKNVAPDETYSYRIQAFSKASESQVKTTSVKMLPLLSVEPSGNALFWKIYPNPVADFLSVEFRNPVTGTISLFNAAGKAVHSAELKSENHYQANVTFLPAGLYILSVDQSGKNPISQKIIKQ